MATGKLGRRLKIGAALAGLTVVLLLGAAEMGLRTFAPVEFKALPKPHSDDDWFENLHRPSNTPGLVYELTPSRELSIKGVAIGTNSHGMRDAEPLQPVPGKELRRIAAVGDSFTFGQGVGNRENWSWYLQELLGESAGDDVLWDVINFGVNGYSSRDEAAVIEHKVFEWDPDLVLLAYALNDPDVDGISGLHDYYEEPAWWRHSHLLRLMAKVRFERGIHSNGGHHVRAVHADPEKWQTVVDAFGAIAAMCEQRDIPVLLTIFPVFYSGRTWAEYELGDVHDKVAGLGRANGFDVVDVREVYAATGKPPLDLSIPDDGHPTPEGHHLAAELLRDRILARTW